MLLVLLSTFTVFYHRHAVQILATARRSEAAQQARGLAEILSRGDDPLELALEHSARLARRAALIRPDGSILAARGDFNSADLLAPVGGRRPQDVVTLGPDPSLPDVVAGFAPLVRRGEPLAVRVDLPATALAAQLRGSRALTWVVLPVNGLLAIFVLLFLRHFLAPYDRLLARARALDPLPASAPEDEISYLLETFDSAMRALARSSEHETEDEISSLQEALGPSLESGVLLLDRRGKIVALNPLGEMILGLSAPYLGRSVAEALASLPELVTILEQAVREQTGSQRLEPHVRVGDEQRVLGLSVHALRRRDGTVRGFLVLFVDLTEAQREAEEDRVSRTLEQLAELSAGIAHELRNGIATIRGYLTLLERRPEEPPPQEYLHEIRLESHRLERVLNDFLTFATPGSLRGEAIDLAGITRRAARDPILLDCRIHLDLEAAAGIEVFGDRQLLEQAVRNLLRNAAEAGHHAGGSTEIDIRIRPAAEGLELSVEDRGPGLPESVRQRLFQPFVSGRAGGAGLGLSLARRIAALHGGRLAIEDRAGGGTRAVLTLPLDAMVTE
jgi:PAS domain S-box-containing protein